MGIKLSIQEKRNFVLYILIQFIRAYSHFYYWQQRTKFLVFKVFTRLSDVQVKDVNFCNLTILKVQDLKCTRNLFTLTGLKFLRYYYKNLNLKSRYKLYKSRTSRHIWAYHHYYYDHGEGSCVQTLLLQFLPVSNCWNCALFDQKQQQARTLPSHVSLFVQEGGREGGAGPNSILTNASHHSLLLTPTDSHFYYTENVSRKDASKSYSFTLLNESKRCQFFSPS